MVNKLMTFYDKGAQHVIISIKLKHPATQQQGFA